MTAFTIDTGDTLDRGPSFGFGNNILLDGVIDSLPVGASQAEIDAATALAIRADIIKPVRAETVRSHFCMHWHLIAPMADRAPEIFDQIIEELHEQLIARS